MYQYALTYQYALPGTRYIIREPVSNYLYVRSYKCGDRVVRFLAANELHVHAVPSSAVQRSIINERSLRFAWINAARHADKNTVVGLSRALMPISRLTPSVFYYCTRA